MIAFCECLTVTETGLCEASYQERIQYRVMPRKTAMQKAPAEPQAVIMCYLKFGKLQHRPRGTAITTPISPQAISALWWTIHRHTLMYQERISLLIKWALSRRSTSRRSRGASRGSC